MLYYDITDISQGIDVNKTSASKECDVCHYCYFLSYSKKMPVIDIMFINDIWNLSDIAVFNIKGSDYRCISSLIS